MTQIQKQYWSNEFHLSPKPASPTNQSWFLLFDNAPEPVSIITNPHDPYPTPNAEEEPTVDDDEPEIWFETNTQAKMFADRIVPQAEHQEEENLPSTDDCE